MASHDVPIGATQVSLAALNERSREIFRSIVESYLATGEPVGFLNVGNYFDKLLAFLDHQTAERFMRQAHRDMLIVEADPDRMLDRCAVYTAPKVGKWIGEDER